MMIRAIIFDFDEVIIRSYKDHLDAFLIVAKNSGYKVKKVEVYRRFGKPAKELLKEILPNLSEKEIEDFVKRKEEVYRGIVKKRGVKLVRGIKTLLKFLKRNKIKIGICSSASIKNILFALKSAKIKEYFDVIVAAEHVKKHKPNPEPLLKTAKLLKEKPKNCVYIGDSIYEMQAARKAKMISIGILTGIYEKDDLLKNGANYVCKNYGEVKRILQKLI